MKRQIFSFLWEYKYIIIPSFLWIGVYFDYAHILLSFPTDYAGLYYGVEINFSILVDLIKNLIQGVI